MSADSLRLEGVYTFSSGTLLQFGDGTSDTVYFHDSNNNLRLDSSDKKVIESARGENVLEFSAVRVGEKDIQTFGARVETVLRQARKERESLPRIIPPRKIGECFFSIKGQERGAMTVKGLQFRFEPPLSAKTLRSSKDKRYQLVELFNWNKNSPLVDPSRCFSARSVFPQARIDKRPLNPQEVELSTGDMMLYPVFTALGLKNGDRLDAAYNMSDGAEHVHIDLAP